MIDTHAHLDSEQFFGDCNDTIERAFSSGLEAIVVPSIAPQNFEAVKAVTKQHKNIYRGIGVHPHHALEANAEVFRIIEIESASEKTVAIGEIGLDYYYDFAPRDVQQRVFRRQLNIAKDIGLPAIVHNRESDEDMMQILKEEQDGRLNAVLHCFSSDEKILEKAIDLGLHISFTGNITYKKSVLGDIVRQTPGNRLMLETDSPYMAPTPHRGKRNEPAFVRCVAEKIAELRQTSILETIRMTTENARLFFRLPILAILLSTLSVSSAVSQKSVDDDDDGYYGSRERAAPSAVSQDYRPAWWQNKSFGAGLILSTNTIVESRTFLDNASRTSISYEGLFTVGGCVSYHILDWLNAETGYVYSQNSKAAIERIAIEPAPNTHQVASVVLRAIANPYSKVNFFALFGMGVVMDKIFDGTLSNPDDLLSKPIGMVSTNKLGISGGAGFSVNIPTSFGMFVPTAEWRLEFPVGSEVRADPNIFNDPNFVQRPYEVSTFLSLPRLTVYFYPKF